MVLSGLSAQNADTTQAVTFQIGDTVVVNRETTHYMTGEKISRWVYNVTHTIRQVGSKFHQDGILLKGIRSWLHKDGLTLVNIEEETSAQNVQEVVQPAVEEGVEPEVERESSPTPPLTQEPQKESDDDEPSPSVVKSAPTRLIGRLQSQDGFIPIAGAVITLANQEISTTTNSNGEFSFLYIEPQDEEVIIEADGYIATVELVQMHANQTNDMGEVVLQKDIAREAQEEILLNLSEEDLNDDEGRSQAQASTSSASQDVFNSTVSYAWSSARYRNRGYEQRVEQNYILGLNFNSAERGQFNFSAMGGLNDASRNKEVVNPMEANNFAFGGIGTNTNYLMNASRFAEGWKVGVAGTNRNYKAAVRATYASGPLQNGWSFVGQIALRFSPYTQAKNQIGEGIEYWSGGYFFSAEKVFNNNKGRLTLVTFGSPTQRGQSAAVTQEAYDLTGSIYYNPYWGYQNGKMRNSRVVKSFDPTAIAHYEITIDNVHHLKAAAGYHYSMYSNSALNFYNAPDPRPDYYRNLPSAMWDGQIANPYNENGANQLFDETGKHYPWGNFIGEDMNGVNLGSGFIGHDGNLVGPSVDADQYNKLVDLWQSRDNKTTQIDWDMIYASNLANNVNNPKGAARYILERRHNDIQEASAMFNYRNTQFDHLVMTAGLEAKYSQGIHYKTIDDLLGGNQWIDVDPFAERDIRELATNAGLTQTDIENVKKNNIDPNYNDTIRLGQRFGYDYRINMNTEKVWFQNEWSFNEVDLYYALQLTYTSMQRTTRMINGRAWYLAQLNPANANLYLGSNAHHFIDPSLKLGATYKINGRNRLKLNALAQTAAPLARDAYVSTRVHDRVLNNIYTHDNAKNLKDYYAASEKMVSADLTYEFNYPIVRGRVTGYFTQFWNGSEMNGYYDDEARTFVNQALSGIDRRHMGIEAAAAIKMGTYFTLTPAVNIGSYKYTSDAMAVTSAENGMSLTEDSDGNPIFETTDKVLLKGLHLSTGPQASASLKLSFFHPKMWFADVTVSYHDWNYLDVAPSRRMQGLFTGTRADGTPVNGWYGDSYCNAIETTDGQPLRKEVDADGVAHYENAVLDENGVPVLRYPFSIMSKQESLAATNPLNRFLIDASLGKLIYLKNRQSLSINLSISNLTNNTHFKTGGYQQARLPRATRQGIPDKENSVITANAWKYPSKYYYAWGANFYATITYKF